MKLQILIPYYDEPFEVVRPLLDSLAIQQNIPFEELGVILCNDGGTTFGKTAMNHLKKYPFKVEHYKCPHKGVSATRNACLDKATAEYVMFCDADDMFFNACGLYIIFREFTVGFDTLMSAFVEESRNPLNKEPVYINHNIDSTFVHGKVHRLAYLRDNNIRWNDSLTIHEDSYFNCLCQRLTPEVKYCQTPFYLWKWRDESVCRHDPLYLNKTMVNMLDSNTALVEQFLSRDRKDDATYFAASMVYDTYYSLNCDRWWEGEGTSYLPMTEKRFAEYWSKYKELFNALDNNQRSQIIMGIKNRFFGEGLLLERITFDDWIKHIESL